MALKPLSDRILVEPIEVEEKTASGIFIPDTAKERPQQGKVIAVGPGRITEDGKQLPVSVAEGQTVLYSQYAGTEIKIDGKEYLILNESEILAIVE